MGRRLLIVFLISLAVVSEGARADAPGNDDWRSATPIEVYPFDATLELAETARELDVSNRCVPLSEWPGAPVNHRYGDAWFKLTPHSTTVAVATAQLDGGVPILGLYREGARGPVEDRCSDNEPGEPASIGIWLTAGVTYFIQVGVCVDCGTPTTVRFRLFEPGESDLAAHSLSVSRPGTVTPVGGIPQPLTREIAFTLENRSMAQSTGVWRVKACHYHSASEYCIAIANGLATLEPGERSPVSVRWDATGSAGDITICATVGPFGDAETHRSNNKVTADTWVLISNVQGESYLDSEFRRCDPYEGLS